MNHGFLLDKNGAMTTFDAPSGGTGPDQGTLPWDINPNGTIAGWTVDDADVLHGFVRNRDGTIVEYDVPGGTMFPWASIAPNGAVVGPYFDATGAVHGFLRQ
jgi:hypothetical protein